MVIESETVVTTGESGPSLSNPVVPFGDAERAETEPGTEATEVSSAEPKEHLPGPQDDPAYKRAKAIMEARMKLDAQREKETKTRKSKNKPHNQKKNKEARKARKRNKK